MLEAVVLTLVGSVAYVAWNLPAARDGTHGVLGGGGGMLVTGPGRSPAHRLIRDVARPARDLSGYRFRQVISPMA